MPGTQPAAVGKPSKIFAVIELRAQGPVVVGWWQARGPHLWGGVLAGEQGASREVVACADGLAATIMAARGPLEVDVERAVVVGLRSPRLTAPPRPMQRRPPRVSPTLGASPVLLVLLLCLAALALPRPAHALTCHEQCKAFFAHCSLWAARAYDADVPRLGPALALRTLRGNLAACSGAYDDCHAWCDGRFSPSTGQIRPVALTAPVTSASPAAPPAPASHSTRPSSQPQPSLACHGSGWVMRRGPAPPAPNHSPARAPGAES